MPNPITDIIDSAFSDKPAGVLSAVDTALAEKVTEVVGHLREKLTKSMFQDSNSRNAE